MKPLSDILHKSISHAIALVILLFVLSTLCSFAQKPDSVKILTTDDFFDLILKYHPVAKQADLIPQMAKQKLVVARGGFDPYFFSSLDRKEFKDSEYFLLNESGLKIPTWYGIEFKGAYTINSGTNVNPQNIMPVGGQALFGISAPMGQGLFTDERRTVLKQAKIFQEASEFERIGLLNNILFQATKDYWEWTYQYNNYNIYQSALTFAQERYVGSKSSFQFGDIPAIDTLEAFIQLQNIQFNLNEALMQYRNAAFNLSNHLWYENNVPLEISNNLIPPDLQRMDFSKVISMDSVEQIINTISQYHPEIKQLQFVLEGMELERKLKIESLKPQVNFNYNVLSNQKFNFSTEPQFSNFFNTNYKWGFDISFPLFWGKERGDFKLFRLKLQDTEYKLQMKNIEITNKIQTYFNEMIVLQQQVKLYNEATDNYNKLLQAESVKFSSGESSMFLVNARQLKYLEFQSKLLEVKSKYFKALAGLAWASGTISQGNN